MFHKQITQGAASACPTQTLFGWVKSDKSYDMLRLHLMRDKS
jgi:hypothetical protein